MPLVRIDLVSGKSSEYRTALADEVYKAMTGTMNVPENDRFMVINEHKDYNLVADPAYLGIQRTRDVVFVQITLNAGRTVEVKKAFYAQLANKLAERINLRKEDLFISLVEVPKENWSFGNGVAQYA
ncbi:tautomerase family protein [Paraburkholderia caledonica]|uniref:Phenylpyruvate tautomerase PptA (4-oxalocrotonate tautomerase family) n=1 Tax=Paraburkholderia caledonica TaxID=134536 RepID=A0ABU1KYU1_9BURK|nr:tautomerase family protein [Paraburkholderia caledonica]MDR6376146.1 phenylpyruvate tautomerase PptA (4-oxalocrotonate tautomerase family) [Paraburkholderia caledonica]